MRRKVFIKGLLFCLLFTFFSSLNQRVYANEDLFKDVPDDHWAYSYIEFLTDQGIIKGYLDGTFKPNATITRLQVATMLTRALKIDTQYYSEPYYEDVNQNTYGYPIIAASRDEGWFEYIAVGAFRPGEMVTRGDMATLLARAFSLPNSSEYYFENTFNDISPRYWAVEYVEALAFNDIVGGYLDGTFRPNNAVTRAEFSKMVYLAIQQSQNHIDMNHRLKDYFEDIYGHSLTKEDLLNIDEINLMESGVGSLRGLEFARNLEGVDLTYTIIRNLTPLFDIQSLRSLTIADSVIDKKMSDQLSQLDQIENLNLSLSAIEDPSFIGNMDSLRVIDLSFTSLTDSEIKDLKTSYPYISFLY